MAVTSHVETERKYEAAADTKLPAWSDIPGVTTVHGPRTEQLSAVYYDTADQRLGRYGATLRRRTGGDDAGWHLKVPAGEDSRTELRLPLDARPEDATNAPPDELADLTFAMTRGAALRPIAQLKTSRRVWDLLGADGAPVAEVTDDQVTATRLDGSSNVDEWRELEVELAGRGANGVLAGAEKVLRKAGIRRAGHSSKLARVVPPPAAPVPDATGTAGAALLAYVQTRFDALVTQDLLVRRDAPDAVHQLRVAARRLRAALLVYRRLLPGTERLRADLRWLGRRLADARDLEVQEKHLVTAVAALPSELVVGPVSARLTRHYSPAAAAARETVTATLADKRYRRVLDDLARLLADPDLGPRASRPSAKELPKHLRRAYRKTKRRLSDDTLHRARKAAKQYRYSLETAEPAVGKAAKEARKRAKALTKLLGEHQDGVVTQPVLRDLGMQAHLASENGFTYGLLLEQERARCARVREVYPAYWRRLRKARPWA
ncbi:MAG: CYTH and CHAD domain-containing protein [Actinophytocola sp.]|uniref:CYTH and CHAD domain-containing protein n=1 Tax=Actinophytocola sp. TaxID=1872138 RepID=UPI003C78246E